MSGGAGDDIYVVDDAGDVVVENPNEGTDLVQSSITYTLGANVENLTLTGNAAINGTGNELANVIIGNTAANTLNGAGGNDTLDGGAGADTMAGGTGDDNYVVDDNADVVTENADEGTDTVRSSQNYVLAANVENLTLTGTAFTAFGNELANVIIGNDADNSIAGLGGADVMMGGRGNDTYIVHDTSDVVVENPGEGVDTIQSHVSYTLPDNVENLVLPFEETDGTGNALNNVIDGSALANTLDGRGGADRLSGGLGDDVLNGGVGDDVLSGEGGADQFVFSVIAAIQGSNVQAVGFGSDTVNDFSAGDKIVLNGVSLTSFQELQLHFTQSGADTIISFPTIQNPVGFPTTNTIKLLNVQASSLTASQFTFTETDRFDGPGNSVLVHDFAIGAGGWVSQNLYPRHVADVNGDGYADIVGFGEVGALVAFGASNGSFGVAGVVVGNFGQTSGWSSDNAFHRELADVNGDGRADIVGFGMAGTWVSLAQANGTFNDPTMRIANFGVEQGWTSQDGFARTVGDVNGDGKADLVGFGQAGTWIALGKGDGSFNDAALAVTNFGVAQGWFSDNSYHRVVADANGDGKDDIIGFGQAGVWLALSNGDGTFADAQFALSNFGKDQGWTTQDAFARVVGDINNDGRADIVGFGAWTSWTAFGGANGTFTAPSEDVANFSQPQGWTSDATYHRELADINHDGHLDIVGFGYAGVLAGLNHGDFYL